MNEDDHITPGAIIVIALLAAVTLYIMSSN
jgi:hypothetical protein